MAKTKGAASRAARPSAQPAARPARSVKTKPAARRPAKRLTKPATTAGSTHLTAAARPTASTRTAASARTTASARAASARTTAASARTAAVAAPRIAPSARRTRRPDPTPAQPGTSDGATPAQPGTSSGATPAQDEPDEPIANRDIGRLLRYGEHFGSEKIDVRALPLQLHATSNALALCDPAEPGTWRVLDRPLGNGAFRVMLSIARPDDAPDPAARERLAAVVIHVGRPPIARWTVAQFRGVDAPSSAGALPRTPVTSGWLALLDARDGSPGVIALPAASGVTPIEVPLTDGRRALALPCGNGAFAAYWAIDADDRPICIVIDFDAFTPKAWKARPPTT